MKKSATTDKTTEQRIADELVGGGADTQPARTTQELENERFKGDTKTRKIVVWWAMGVVSLWLAAVLILLFVQFFRQPQVEVFPSYVWVTLLATTTANVLGLMFLVISDLFPKGGLFSRNKG